MFDLMDGQVKRSHFEIDTNQSYLWIYLYLANKSVNRQIFDIAYEKESTC